MQTSADISIHTCWPNRNQHNPLILTSIVNGYIDASVLCKCYNPHKCLPVHLSQRSASSVTFFIFIKICSHSLAFLPTCLILQIFALSWIYHLLYNTCIWKLTPPLYFIHKKTNKKNNRRLWRILDTWHVGTKAQKMVATISGRRFLKFQPIRVISHVKCWNSPNMKSTCI